MRGEQYLRRYVTPRHEIRGWSPQELFPRSSDRAPRGAAPEISASPSTLVRAVRRQWPLALVGFVATLAGTYQVGVETGTGVYFQEASLIFFAPDIPDDASAFQQVPESLISVAGIVGRQVDQTTGVPASVTSKVSIVDVGIRDGVWVRLPNEGGQWNLRFDRAILEVQVAGPEPEKVRTRMSSTINRIRRVLRADQESLGVPAGDMIEIAVIPPSPPVLHRQGSVARSVVSVFALGVGMTVTLIFLLDRRIPEWFGLPRPSASYRRLRAAFFRRLRTPS